MVFDRPISILMSISRLNSGNFEIFFPSESILILNSSDQNPNRRYEFSRCIAFETIQNYMKIVTFPWNFKVENPCFNFCMGVYEGEKDYLIDDIDRLILMQPPVAVFSFWAIYFYYKPRIFKTFYRPFSFDESFRLVWMTFRLKFLSRSWKVPGLIR